MKPDVFDFGDFTLDPSRRQLTRRNGEPVAITGKPFDALVYLVRRRGQVVTRSELAEALWPTVVVEDNNLSQTILAIRRALGESEAGPRYVATVPRRGYQFVADVSVPSPSLRERRHPVPMIAILAAALIPAVTLPFWISADDRAATVRMPDSAYSAPAASPDILPRSVAVLPFRNLSASAEDAYFAAGMHEEVLTRLAKVRGLNVIARTSVMRYADTTAPVGEIASALRVATVLEGSVRYAPDRVRVSARLIDASSGAELWSEHYDSPLSDVFEIQGDIANRIASALETRLPAAATEGTAVTPVPTQSLSAYAEYLKALALYRVHGGIGVSAPAQVRASMAGHLDEALRLDPGFPNALAWKAHLALDSMLFDDIPEAQWAQVSARIVADAERDARRALARDPTLGIAHTTLARLDMFRWKLDAARTSLENAIGSNPNDPIVLHYSAMLHCLLRQPDEAIERATRATQLDPANPAPYTLLTVALRAKGDNAAAEAAVKRLIERAPNAALGYIALARVQTAANDPSALRETLRLGEPFLADMRNLRVDAAISYRRAGATADAERLVRAFRENTKGRHVDPGLDAMALLAEGNHEAARRRVLDSIQARDSLHDPFSLLLIRENTWSDPKLETKPWVEARRLLEYANN